MIEGKTDDPVLDDFYNDMNQHGAADYRRVPPRWVIEVDSRPGGFSVTVWAAVRMEHRDAYAEPDNPDNRYAWNAAGRAGFDSRDKATRAADRITGKGDVRDFCDEYPYEGPRSENSDVAE